MANLHIDIITAERVVYSGEADLLVVPGAEGELGILPSHAPLLTMIQPGVLRIVQGDEETAMAITGGFMEVRENRVTILADAAERAEEIDVARAEEARRRAQERLERRAAEADMARAQAALQRALARLRAVERRRRRATRRTGPPGP